MTVVERISALPGELRLEILDRCSLGELMILANVNQKARKLVKSRMQELCLHVPGELHDLDQTSLRTLRYICADTTKTLIVLLPEARCLSTKYDPKPFHAADLQWKTLTSVMTKMTVLSSLQIGNPSSLNGNFSQSMKLAEMLTVMLLSKELPIEHLQIWATAEMTSQIMRHTSQNTCLEGTHD
ncbi:uncharacterized protein BBA_09626 [Beauveria bassiana ARSEF 2860]|uniref:F-box domain-containing protein n=1 Tax=Beauveria bassiana (strain ARSEF 2860) TaxID=655819 RepID=J5JBZ1_BEAB2|nr:uncharacterized protein BBA_09626 [Beauveria bassiana ARSEF 2860]EJP61436.1 hypothetical protein BBA_09626 [Beauveria bassiana ARSEF 2860]